MADDEVEPGSDVGDDETDVPSHRAARGAWPRAADTPGDANDPGEALGGLELRAGAQGPLGADPHDFAGLYVRHRASFTLHARRYLRDERDADEVVQEAFLRLFLALPEIETELQALAYCRRTITNLCIDRYRTEARRPRLVHLEAVPLEELPDEDTGDPVVRAEDAALVREALSLLSPMHRAALVKREIEEKPLPVIAEELAIPEESVKHLLFRARKALRRLLAATSLAPGRDGEDAPGPSLPARAGSGGLAALVLALVLGIGSGPNLEAIPVVGVDLPDVIKVTALAKTVGTAVTQAVDAVGDPKAPAPGERGVSAADAQSGAGERAGQGGGTGEVAGAGEGAGAGAATGGGDGDAGGDRAGASAPEPAPLPPPSPSPTPTSTPSPAAARAEANGTPAPAPETGGVRPPGRPSAEASPSVGEEQELDPASPSPSAPGPSGSASPSPSPTPSATATATAAARPSGSATPSPTASAPTAGATAGASTSPARTTSPERSPSPAPPTVSAPATADTLPSRRGLERTRELVSRVQVPGPWR